MDAANIAIACVAVVTSAVSALIAWGAKKQTHRQADMAVAQVELSAQTGQSATVIHFTSRFFDLIRDGMRFDNDEWRYQYWSLHATEFYFFHNGWLPRFIYELWVVELVNRCYRAQPKAWSWHRTYLNLYSISYYEMGEFFSGLHEIAMHTYETERDRNAEITTYVGRWYASATPPTTSGPLATGEPTP
jgi:hypothetical protein